MYSVNPLDYSFGHIDSFYWTSAGALSVLLMKKEPKPSLQNFLLGFSAGVMIAASVLVFALTLY